MEISRFNELSNNPATLIIETAGCAYFKDPTDTIAIFFCFCYYGLDSSHKTIPDKRISLKKYLVKDLIPEIKLQTFSDQLVILVNADTFEYALSYELILDEKKRTIELRLLDLPNMAEHFITQEEKEGITIEY